MNTYLVISASQLADGDEYPDVRRFVFHTKTGFAEFCEDWVKARAYEWNCDPDHVWAEWAFFDLTSDTIGRDANRRMGYGQFMDEDGDNYGSFRVYLSSEGWRWVSEQPDCLPDGEPSEPFATSEDAWTNARCYG